MDGRLSYSAPLIPHNPLVALGSLLGLSLVIGLVIEACTLFGARTASVLNLSCWRLARVLIYALIVFAISVYLYWGRSSGQIRSLTEAVSCVQKGLAGYSLKLFVIPFALSTLVGLSISLFIMAMNRAWDARYTVVAFSFTLSLSLIGFNFRAICNRLEWGFLALALPLGLMTCALMPTLAEVTWDGQIHFRNTVCLSYLMDSEFTDADLLMTDAMGVKRLDMFGSGDMTAVWYPKQDRESVDRSNAELLRLDGGNVTVFEGVTSPNGKSYLDFNRIGYVPQAFGLWLGRLLKFDCLSRYLLARTCSMLVYVSVFFCSIRRLRSGKAIVAVLGLLPAPFLMAANFSYDPWWFALTTYSFARYTSVLQSEDGWFTPFDVTTILAAFTFGTFVKAINLPIALVFLCMPKNRFRTKAEKNLFRVASVLIVSLLAFSFILPLLSGSTSVAGSSDPRGGAGVSAMGQISYVLSDIPRYLRVFASFSLGFFGLHNLPLLLFTNESYLYPDSMIMGLWVAALLLFVLLFSRLANDPLFECVPIRAAALIGVAFAYFLSVSALYASFTPVGSDTVGGVQHRYLLECCSALSLLCIGSKRCSGLVSKETITAVTLGAEYLLMLYLTYCAFLSAFI